MRLSEYMSYIENAYETLKNENKILKSNNALLKTENELLKNEIASLKLVPNSIEPKRVDIAPPPVQPNSGPYQNT